MGTTQLSQNFEQGSDEQLVAVRPDVLSDAEHALGNLLQRIHYVVRACRDSLGPHGERISGALDDLERLLELLLDYVSPIELEVRPTDGGRIAESLVAQVRACGAAEPKVGNHLPIRVVADPRVLNRSFQLLGRACEQDWKGASHTFVEVRHSESADLAEFVVYAQVEGATSAAADAKLAAAVAARLIELQGGEVRWTSSAGGVSCSVILPTAK